MAGDSILFTAIVMIAMFAVFVIFAEADRKWKILAGFVVAIDVMLRMSDVSFVVPMLIECVMVICMILYWTAQGAHFGR